MSSLDLQTVRFGPRERQGFVLGLRVPQLVMLVVAALCVIRAVTTLTTVELVPIGPAALKGVGAVLLWLILGVLAVVVALVPVRGRQLDQYLPVVANFAVQRLRGQDSYRGGPGRDTAPDGSSRFTLPGRWANITDERVPIGPDGEEAAVLVDKNRGEYRVILVCEGANFPLDEAIDRNRSIEQMGMLLQQLCVENSGIKRIQLLERVEPDSGESVVRHFQRNVRDDDASFAAQSYRQLLRSVSGVQQAHEAYVGVCIDKNKMRGEIRDAGGGELGAKLVAIHEASKIADSLRAARVEVLGIASPRQLGYIVRTAFDPASRDFIDLRGGGSNDDAGGDPGIPSGVEPAAAGPMAAENHWDHYRTDSAVHRTWWIMEWPRQEVQAGFLTPLLLMSQCRRTVSLTIEPLSTRAALRRLGRKATEAGGEEGLRRKIGRRTTKQQEVEGSDLARREAELVAGAGMCRILGLITTSAADLHELATNSREIERLASQSNIEITRLYAEQDQAFIAGALPLCGPVRNRWEESMPSW